MTENTKILRSLTVDEIFNLKQELLLIDHLWAGHGGPKNCPTALIHGKTVYLNTCHDDGVTFVKHCFELTPETKKIIDSIIAPYHLGRVYWHRLMPGDIITSHTDSEVIFVKNKILAHRYQIYLDTDDSILLMLDGKLVPGSKYSNCLIDFDLRQMHAYRNTSSNPWYLLVFDALNQPLQQST